MFEDTVELSIKVKVINTEYIKSGMNIQLEVIMK